MENTFESHVPASSSLVPEQQVTQVKGVRGTTSVLGGPPDMAASKLGS